MDPAFLPFLAGVAKYAELGRGEIIFDEGSEADKFYLIQWGCVGLDLHVPGGRPVIVQRIGNGEALGWSWFYPPHTWRFTARTLDATELIVFDAEAIRAHADADHDFGYDLTVRMGQIMQDRLQATRALLVDYCH